MAMALRSNPTKGFGRPTIEVLAASVLEKPHPFIKPSQDITLFSLHRAPAHDLRVTLDMLNLRHMVSAPLPDPIHDVPGIPDDAITVPDVGVECLLVVPDIHHRTLPVAFAWLSARRLLGQVDELCALVRTEDIVEDHRVGTFVFVAVGLAEVDVCHLDFWAWPGEEI